MTCSAAICIEVMLPASPFLVMLFGALVVFVGARVVVRIWDLVGL